MKFKVYHENIGSVSTGRSRNLVAPKIQAVNYY